MKNALCCLEENSARCRPWAFANRALEERDSFALTETAGAGAFTGVDPLTLEISLGSPSAARCRGRKGFANSVRVDTVALFWEEQPPLVSIGRGRRYFFAQSSSVRRPFFRLDTRFAREVRQGCKGISREPHSQRRGRIGKAKERNLSRQTLRFGTRQLRSGGKSLGGFA
jgi:hypothetical protein